MVKPFGTVTHLIQEDHMKRVYNQALWFFDQESKSLICVRFLFFQIQTQVFNVDSLDPGFYCNPPYEEALQSMSSGIVNTHLTKRKWNVTVYLSSANWMNHQSLMILMCVRCCLLMSFVHHLRARSCLPCLPSSYTGQLNNDQHFTFTMFILLFVVVLLMLLSWFLNGSK